MSYNYRPVADCTEYIYLSREKERNRMQGSFFFIGFWPNYEYGFEYIGLLMSVAYLNPAFASEGEFSGLIPC